MKSCKVKEEPVKETLKREFINSGLASREEAIQFVTENRRAIYSIAKKMNPGVYNTYLKVACQNNDEVDSDFNYAVVYSINRFDNSKGCVMTHCAWGVVRVMSERLRKFAKESRVALVPDFDFIDCSYEPEDLVPCDELPYLNKLPERWKEIIIMYFVQSLTKKEIGDLMNISKQRVDQIIKSSISKLRDIIEFEGPSRCLL